MLLYNTIHTSIQQVLLIVKFIFSITMLNTFIWIYLTVYLFVYMRALCVRCKVI